MIEIVKINRDLDGPIVPIRALVSDDVKRGDVWISNPVEGGWSIHSTKAFGVAGKGDPYYRSVIMIIKEHDETNK